MTDDLLAAFVGLLPGACAVRPAVPPRDIADLYRLLPDGTPRLPRLYEEFLCRYEWHQAQDESDVLQVRGYEFRLYEFRLWSNAGARETFGPLVKQMNRDPALGSALVQAGYFPFARGGAYSYDRLCFPLRQARGYDCPVVIVDHEAVLCFDRIEMRDEVAPTFRAFCQHVITDTQARRQGQRDSSQ